MTVSNVAKDMREARSALVKLAPKDRDAIIRLISDDSTEAELTSLREEVERLSSQNELIGPLVGNVGYVRDNLHQLKWERAASMLTDCLSSFWESYESTHINDARKALDNTGEQNND